jgi:hypothetical protein
MARNGLKRTTSVPFAAGVATVIAAGTIFAAISVAQTPQSTGTPSPSMGVPEAPVGHRQPRPSDLPPSVQREEQTNAPAQNNPPRRRDRQDSTFGQLPTICVRC